jgi:hypothetical protein
MRLERRHFFLAIILACGLAGRVSHTQTASNRSFRMPPSPGTNEIQLNGTIRSVDAQKRRLTLNVSSFAFPGDKVHRLPTWRAKLIRVPLYVKMRDIDASKEISFSDLQTGREASVVGTDLGWRKELNAREVLISGPKTSGLPVLPYGEIDERDLAIAKQQEEITQLRDEMERLKEEIKSLREIHVTEK